MDRWKYVGKLYEQNRPEQIEIDVPMAGPPIKENEVENAPKKLKD